MVTQWSLFVHCRVHLLLAVIAVRLKHGMNEKDVHVIAVKGYQKRILPSSPHTPSVLLIGIVLPIVCSKKS